MHKMPQENNSKGASLMKKVRITTGTLTDFFNSKYTGEMPKNPPQEKIVPIKNIPRKKLIISKKDKISHIKYLLVIKIFIRMLS